MPVRNPLATALARIPVRREVRKVAGADTAIWHYGPAHATNRVLLVHGFRGTHHGLLGLVAAMPNTAFIAPDLPGFGESGPLPGGHTLDGYAEWLLALEAALQDAPPSPAATARQDTRPGTNAEARQDAAVGTAATAPQDARPGTAAEAPQAGAPGALHLLGHSFGTLIVARAVARLRTRSILLVNPIAQNALHGPARIGTALAIAYYRVGAAAPAPLGDALLRSRLATRVMSEVMAVKRDRALRAWVHAEHDRHFSDFRDRGILLDAFRASVSDDVLAHAAEFPPGCDLVVGERDAIVPLAASRRLAAAMPGSTLHIVHGVGHLVHYEAPFALARILSARLAHRATS